MGKVRTVREKLQRNRARALRRDDTAAEARFWAIVRDRRLGGWKWRRQVPIAPYIVDFLCQEARLIVELDGSQHADNVAYDERRSRHLAALGFRVIRFWNSEVLTNSDGVCLTLLDACGGECPTAPLVGPGWANGDG